MRVTFRESRFSLALALPFLLSCRDPDAGAPAGSASAAPTAAPYETASAVASASRSAPTTSSSAAEATPAISAEEFCAQAVKLGEDNLAKCATSEKANIPSMGHVKDLSRAKQDCSMRVGSPNVDYHGEAGARCIGAARKRGGKTSFFSFDLVPACRDVLTGKATEGKPVKFAEECAPGLAILRNRCVKAVAENGACGDYPAGLLSKPDEHPRCAPGLDCFFTKGGADGLPSEFACMRPSDVGARCKLAANTCADGTTCYQGKCRAKASRGGDCMADRDCAAGLVCEILGGVFGKCAEGPTQLETCR